MNQLKGKNQFQYKGAKLTLNIKVWNQFRHEQNNEMVKEIYPKGINGAIWEFLQGNDFESVTTATLDEPLHGLADEVLENTDVLIWWGASHHHEVSDEVILKIKRCVLNGMGQITLQSAHYSKIFPELMGTDCEKGSIAGIRKS